MNLVVPVTYLEYHYDTVFDNYQSSFLLMNALTKVHQNINLCNLYTYYIFPIHFWHYIECRFQYFAGNINT